MTPDLPESRIYTFVNDTREFALHFLEGQKLIYDLALLHPIEGGGFSYFRDTVLSVQLMVTLLKQGQHFGFYIDSEEPYFRLKLETNARGLMRSLLVPENALPKCPDSVSGIARFVKLFSNNQEPYSSIIQLKQTSLKEIVNEVLSQSYQVKGKIVVSEETDQSLLLIQLPSLSGDPDELDPDGLSKFWDANQDTFHELFKQALTDPETIAETFSQHAFQLLAGRTVKFRCDCSKEQMTLNLTRIPQPDRADLFDLGQDTLEITCEYCKTVYLITKREIDERVGRPN